MQQQDFDVTGKDISKSFYDMAVELVRKMDEELTKTFLRTFREFGFGLNTTWEFLCNPACVNSVQMMKVLDKVNDWIREQHDASKHYYYSRYFYYPDYPQFQPPCKCMDRNNLEHYNRIKELWTQIEMEDNNG